MASLSNLCDEHQRAIMDLLPRGDQCAFACTSRDARRVERLKSLDNRQRLAAALRDRHMPWDKLAREHLTPQSLFGLMSVAEELNRTPRNDRFKRAPSEWAFRRQLATGSVYRSSVQRIMTIIAAAPKPARGRAKKNYGLALGKHDVLSRVVRTHDFLSLHDFYCEFHWVTIIPTPCAWMHIEEGLDPRMVRHGFRHKCAYVSVDGDGTPTNVQDGYNPYLRTKNLVPRTRQPKAYRILEAQCFWAKRKARALDQDGNLFRQMSIPERLDIMRQLQAAAPMTPS